MRKIAIIFTVFFIVFAFGIAPPSDAKTNSETYNGRSYELTIPKSKPETPRPTLFILHGGGGNGKKMRKHFSFSKLANKDGVVLVYPSGVDGHWNDGRKGSKKTLKHAANDDVAFLMGLAEHLVKTGIARKSQIYVVGVSNGGMMTQRLLCDASDTFTAGASIIAGLPETLESCKPKTPRSILMINGDKDPIMPWNGGAVGFRKNRGLVLSGMESLFHWLNVNECTLNDKPFSIPNKNKKDGTKAALHTSSLCKNGTSVQLVQIIGGGHNVPSPPKMRARPGSKKYKRRAKILGAYNHDFDARAMVWSFFDLHQK